MSLPGQNIQPDRYTTIPRTLTFLFQGSQILLLELSNKKGDWAGKLNGIGGHIEQGEHPHHAALREVREETGIDVPGLSLVGVVLVDTATNPGIGLYVFAAEIVEQPVIESKEGQPKWIKIDELARIPLVEDLSNLIPKALRSYQTGTPFSCLTTFDEHGAPHLEFIP